MKKSVLILSFHFFPGASIGAKRPTELARRLREEGCQVTAVVSRAESVGSNDNKDYCRGTRIVYLPLIPSVEDSLFKLLSRLRGFTRRKAKQADLPEQQAQAQTSDNSAEESLAKRLQRHFHSFKLTFGIGKAWALLAFLRVLLLRLQGRFDVVISSGPPMVANIAGFAVARLLGCKYIIDLRDPWDAGPNELAVYRSRLRQRLELKVRQKCLRAADLIVCASPGTRRTVIESVPDTEGRTRIIYNGYDAPNPDQKDADLKAPEGMLRIIFAGTIYLNRDPLPLFAAVLELLEDPAVDRSRVRLDLFGDCGSFGDIDLAAWLAGRGLQDCVRLHAPVSFAEIQREIAASTVLLNFAQGQKNQIPAKTFEYLTTGKQTLTITEPDSDTAGVINDSGFGIVVAPDDDAGLRRALRELYDFFVRDKKDFDTSDGDLERFSRKTQNDKYVAVLNELFEPGASA